MPHLLQFGPYTVAVPEGDLYKGKTRIRLQQHPATVLVLLLERAGEIVSREEIRARVWPNGTLVEFDHGINTAVNRLRAALGDRAENPRYIETVARRGYRFAAPVRQNQREASETVSAEPEPDPPAILPVMVISHYRIVKLIGSGAVGSVYEAVDLNLDRRVALKFLADSLRSDERTIERFGREARILSAIAAAVAIAILGAGAMALRKQPRSAALTVAPITSTPGLKEHIAVSRAGSRIAFAWYSEGSNEDIFVQAMNSHTPVRLTASPARDFSLTWSPDGRYVAFLQTESGRTGYLVVPAAGGGERKVGNVPVNAAPFCKQLDWSRVEDHIAVIDWKPAAAGGPSVVLVSAADGRTLRRISFGNGDFLCAPAFSPDGQWLAVLSGPDFRVADVYIAPVAGGPERRITTDARMMQRLTWTPNGSGIIYSLRRRPVRVVARTRRRQRGTAAS